MVLAALFGRRGADEARLAHVLRDVPLFRELPSDDLVEVWRRLRLVEARYDSGKVKDRLADHGRSPLVAISASTIIFTTSRMPHLAFQPIRRSALAALPAL